MKIPSSPPADYIIRAFGQADTVSHVVSGGQGVTFRAGNQAIKRCEDNEQTEWLGGLLETLPEQGFRIARPVRATSGNFVVDGWCATQWIEGTTALEGRWADAIEASIAFHRALEHVPWPPVLHRLNNPYVRADAAIWAGSPQEAPDIGQTARRLQRLLQPVTLPSQLVHADLGPGNLLFAPGQSMGIIDMAPYWHPASYALAVLVADGIAWSGAPLNLLTRIRSLPQMDQMLVRAVLFRLHVAFLFRGEEAGAESRARAYAPVIEALEQSCG